MMVEKDLEKKMPQIASEITIMWLETPAFNIIQKRAARRTRIVPLNSLGEKRMS